MPRVFLMACFAGALGAAAACSSPSSSSPSPSNDGGSDSTDGPASDSGTAEVIADAAPATVNGCTAADFAANDRTADAAERVILAPDGPAPAQFSPHCMRVRASQTVTWKGDLSSHPISYKLIAAADGGFNDAATVATHGDADGGATQDTVQANDEMTIAFRCDEHPTIMFGAVDVVP